MLLTPRQPAACDRCKKLVERSTMAWQRVEGRITKMLVCPRCLDRDDVAITVGSDAYKVRDARPADFSGQWLTGNPMVPLLSGTMFNKPWGTK